MKKLTRIISAFFFASTAILSAQQVTSSSQIEQALQQKEALTKNSIVKNIQFTNIGPTIMSGRVVDIDVNPNNTNEFYVGYASGGLWYTNNNGTSFTPVIDNSPTKMLEILPLIGKTEPFGSEPEKAILLVLHIPESEF